jgi:serine/threonine protein kinase
MGSIYLAKHIMLDKTVALKTFKSYNLSQEAKLRFQREAQAIAKLNNPNIVQVFDFGYVNEQLPYYTMEVLTGQSLGEKLNNCQYLEIAEAIDVFVEVCRGLLAAHNKGIVHRDLKPDNIFLESEVIGNAFSNVKIVDFGIAALANPDIEGQKLTAIGTVFGSPLYMSPEQSMGKKVTASSDIYSCGCALFQALTGRPPYLGPNAFSTLLMHQNDSIPSLSAARSNRECPKALEQLVTKMLAKAPEERYQSAEEVLENLLSLQQTAKINQSRSTSEQIPNSTVFKASSSSTQGETAGQNLANKRKLKLQISSAFLAVMLLLAVGYGYFAFRDSRKPELEKPKPAATDSVNDLSDKAVNEKHKIKEGKESKRNKTSSEIDDPEISIEELKQLLARPSKGDIFSTRYEKVTAPALELISNTKWIKVISIKDCTVENESLGKLSKLDLVCILLNYTNFNDRGAAGLSQCKTLTEIDASGTFLSDKGLKQLIKLKGLQRLSIGGSKVSKEGLAELARCKNLRILSLSNMRPLTNDHIASVTKIASLNELNLNKTDASPLLIRTLCKNHKNLKKVQIGECQKIGPNEVKLLNIEFPKTTFIRD